MMQKLVVLEDLFPQVKIGKKPKICMGFSILKIKDSKI
jgi:hypothetical protein